MRVIRHEIIQYVTDRPGQVVYRKDVAEATGFTEGQVTAVMLNVQRETPLGPEIQTIVTGNAWRYVPNRPTSVNGHERNANLGLSLVGLIRDYFRERPGKVVSLEELIEHTGRTEAQVKVGVNNARSNHPAFRRNVETIVAGKMWRYVGDVPAPQPVAAPTPVATPVAVPTSPSVPSEPVAAPSPDDDGGSARLFEEVGTANNQIIIRDSEGVLYRATPLD